MTEKWHGMGHSVTTGVPQQERESSAPGNSLSQPIDIIINGEGEINPLFRFPINVCETPYEAKGDGKTDDTDAINWALEEGAKERRPVFIPYGQFIVSELITPSHTELFGFGYLSEIQVMNNTPSAYAISNNDTELGDRDICIRDLAIYANKLAAGPNFSATILMSAEDETEEPGECVDIRIERVYCRESPGLGIVLVNCKTFRITECLVKDNSRDGITCYYSCKQGVISGNIVERCNDDSIALNAENEESEEHELENVIVTGNVIRGPAPNKGSYGAITVRGARHCSITDNVIDAVRQYGIGLFDYNFSPVGDILIANNVLSRVGENGEGFRSAIALYAGLLGEAGINDVTIVGNHIREPASHGIHLQNDEPVIAGVQNVNIVGNFVDRAGLAESIGVPFSGIFLNDSVMQSITISNNVCHHNTGWGIKAVTTAGRLQFITCVGNACFNNKQMGIEMNGVVAGAAVANITYNQEAKGGPQQWGIRLRSLKGEWHIANNVSFNNTRDYEYALMEGAQFRDSFFGRETRLRPAIKGSRKEGTALANLLTEGASLGLWINETTA